MMGSGEELVAGRDRVTVLTSVVLLLIAAAVWGAVIRSSLQGDDMMMTMSMPATVADGFAFVVGWGVMMTAMMLPSAVPMISLYGATQRGSDGARAKGVPVAGFTAVYLVLWAASGIPVYLAHTVLMTLPGSPFAYAVAVILLAAGVFQLSPLKQVCLRACRSPLAFLLGHWRAGRRGSLALGWSHAIYCLGCCWALMLVLAAAGAMGLRWVLLITAVVAAEKLLPGGEWIARAAGVALQKATAAQRDALVAIGSGQGGGPMGAVGPLVGTFAGVESKPIRIERSGMRRSVSIPGMLDIAVEGIPGASPTEPIYLDNVGHPAASRLALAKASRGHMHAFGINWDDTSGRINGHFAPFAWSSS